MVQVEQRDVCVCVCVGQPSLTTDWPLTDHCLPDDSLALWLVPLVQSSYKWTTTCSTAMEGFVFFNVFFIKENDGYPPATKVQNFLK